MTRYFNTEGICKPKERYMVRLDDRLETITFGDKMIVEAMV